MNGKRQVVLAVECDFPGYQPYEGLCTYDHAQSKRLVSLAVDFVLKVCGGKGVFFIHTSPFMRRNHSNPFFNNSEYLNLWQRVQDGGGEIGLHPHEEEPDGSCFYYYYSKHMERVINEHAELLRSRGFNISSQMMGYFGMNEWITPIAENQGLVISMNNVGKYVKYSHNNWNEAPLKPYFHSYDDSKAPGDSRVLEIPLGMTDLMRYEDGLVLDANSLWDLKRTWRQMEAEGKTWPCFVLLRASKIEQCRATAERFLGFITKRRAMLSTPSEIYKIYTEGQLY
ncbi:MAG: hypothetical protein QHH26_03300 [Armatimonadota bacterium]|nr:hypothetical protein [Armatimonadota bacterium]